ncbi:N-acetyltransferase family protein [Bacillus sp. AK128]
MEKIKQKINIVEYHEGLAAGVADMWNHSREGWGGDSHVTTEEKVRTQEGNSSNLNLYLAMEDDRVVGYCGLSEYREDEGALYIPLLNVRTNDHGKKIGKKLVLTAIERAVELGWPRLDLYTWPGNTKAVPLYKKCGFFWEDRDDTTHLMNFIPTVLQTEAVADFFQINNWYDASSRVIEVTPDGRKDNDFSYYEYKWEGHDQTLRMEFERTGRGLRLIETDDYVISCEVENFKLVTDASYKVSYHVRNKTGVPLHIELEGENHRLIQFPFKQTANVEDETVLEGMFRLNGFEEEQSNWRTHPSVITNLKINGKQARFAVGILPKLPAKMKGIVPESQCFLNDTSVFYVDIENNYQEEASFTLLFPKEEMLQLGNEKYVAKVAAKGKVSIPISYKLNQFGFYSPEIEVEVLTQSGIATRFTKKIGVGFKGLGAQFSGECDDYWHIYNGLYHLYLSKFDSKLIPGRRTTDSQNTFSMFPKIGKPYSGEFSKRKPKSIQYQEENGAMVLYATYESTEFPGLDLISVSKLYAEGLVEQSYKLANHLDTETEQEAWVYQPIVHQMFKPVFPMNHQVIEVNEQAYADFGLWNSKNLTESWLFSRHNPYPHGICWPKEAKVNFESWYMYVEHNVGKVPAQSVVETKPVYLSIGAYQTWEEFRDFATRKTQAMVTPVDDMMLAGVEANGQQVEISFIDQKESLFDGNISINYGSNKVNKEFKSTDQKRSMMEKITSNNTLSSVKASYDLNGIHSFKNALVFTPNSGRVQYRNELRENHEVTVASNGMLSISASASFYPGLFSLVAHDKEWLDSSFPTLKPRAWWNPWSGGIRSSIQGMSHKSFAKEETTVSEGSLYDCNNVEWKGLKITSNVQVKEEYKGLEVQQYYVMLPNAPILAHVTKFVQNTGTYFHHKKWFTETCFLPGETLDQGWIKSNREKGTYFAGKTEIAALISEHVIMGSTIDDHILQMIIDRDVVESETYMNKEIQSLAVWHLLSLASGQEWISSPSFYVAMDTLLSEDEVKQLQRIQLREV